MQSVVKKYAVGKQDILIFAYYGIIFQKALDKMKKYDIIFK